MAKNDDCAVTALSGETMPCCGIRIWESALLSLVVVVQNCCQPSVASVIDVQRVNLPRVTAFARRNNAKKRAQTQPG